MCVCVCVCGRLVVVTGGCLDTDLCTKWFHKRAASVVKTPLHHMHAAANQPSVHHGISSSLHLRGGGGGGGEGREEGHQNSSGSSESGDKNTSSCS